MNKIMKKNKKITKKDIIYLSIIALLVISTVILSILLVVANLQKNDFEHGEYYHNKVTSFGVQNANLSSGQIVFIGDSITDLYPLDSYYGDLDRACYNRGIGGDTTQGVIDRLKVSIFDVNPSTIVLMIGTNDIDGGIPNDKIIENYKIILSEINRNQPMVELYFVSVIPQNKDLEGYTDLDVDKNNKTILMINEEIQKLCNEFGCTYIDLHSSLLDDNGYLRKEFSDDGIHLNANGFEVWTNLLKPYLNNSGGVVHG